MRKIPTLFKRDFTQPRHPITPEYNEDAQWVIDGEGIPTRKYDGTSVLIEKGKMYKRYEVRTDITPPDGFMVADVDTVTGKTFGWLPVGYGPEDQWFREATDGEVEQLPMQDGTYELLGPKIQGNPEKMLRHVLLKHSYATTYNDVPTEFESLREWLTQHDIEGIVWHHKDGRMVKIKKKDFGLKR